MLENFSKIIDSSCFHSSAKPTITHYPQAPQLLFFNTSRDGNYTRALDRYFFGLITLSVKKFS